VLFNFESHRSPDDVVTFKYDGNYPFSYSFTLKHFLDEISKAFAVYNTNTLRGHPSLLGIGHIIKDHLPESKAEKSAFDLPTIVELFDPDAKAYLNELRFGPETFQWQSAVLYLFLRSCLLHYTIARIEERYDGNGYSSKPVFYVELPKNIGWRHSKYERKGGPKELREDSRFVRLVFMFGKNGGGLLFCSAYPIPEPEWRKCVAD
jgi:hypothetical protein